MGRNFGRGRAALALVVCGAGVFSAAGAGTVTRMEAPVSPAPPPAAVAVVAVVPTAATAQPLPAPAPEWPRSPDQWFRPGGRNAGTESLVETLVQLALRDNAPLYRSDGWGRTTGSASSDHHVSQVTSWAADVAVRGVNVPTPATATAATRIAAALGVADWAGGDLTKVVDGYRFQVLWKVSGHFDHVHVGVRRV